jgi:hypothetical protein
VQEQVQKVLHSVMVLNQNLVEMHQLLVQFFEQVVLLFLLPIQETKMLIHQVVQQL